LIFLFALGPLIMLITFAISMKETFGFVFLAWIASVTSAFFFIVGVNNNFKMQSMVYA